MPNPLMHAPTAPLLTIGMVAKQAGVTVRTLRYYEELGLIAPFKRSDSKYRLYPERVLKRIQAILSLQALGYSLEETLVLLGPHSSDNQSTSKHTKVQATRESLGHIARCIDEKLNALQLMKQDVDNRLRILESTCQPCMQVNPALECDTQCDHRDVHID